MTTEILATMCALLTASTVFFIVAADAHRQQAAFWHDIAMQFKRERDNAEFPETSTDE